MKLVGPTFQAELAAAGLPSGVWQDGDGNLHFGPSLTPDQQQTAMQVYAAHDPSALPSAVPEVISDRQCFQQLAIDGHITQDEALAAVTVGALPKAVTDGIAGLPAAQQFGARMLLCGATEFHRSHPMVLVFLSFFGLGESDRDPLWTAAAAL